MKLRDRIRRWWSPARWEEEHGLDPAERKRREANWSRHDPKQLRRRVENPNDPLSRGPGPPSTPGF